MRAFKILLRREKMPKRKEPVSLTDKIRQEVLKEYARVPGEDYEDWCEFVRYETDSRLQQVQELRILFFEFSKK